MRSYCSVDALNYAVAMCNNRRCVAGKGDTQSPASHSQTRSPMDGTLDGDDFGSPEYDQENAPVVLNNADVRVSSGSC